jgi:abhydrolase domain-containing protein 6
LFSYYDNHNPNKEVLLILHGFTSNKEECLELASKLSDNYRIIIPDLIGHGDTMFINNNTIDEYSIDVHMRYLYEFIINIFGHNKKIHILGHSMGGLLAGCFAADYTEIIKSLILISPAGISMPMMSPVYTHYVNTNNNLLSIKTVGEAKELVYLLNSQYATKLPNFIFEYYANEYRKNAYIYDKIFVDTIVSNYQYLEKKLKFIKCNMLVIWGENDKIIDRTCIIPLLDNINVDAKIHIVIDAGHIIHTTHAGECAEHICDHIKKNI